MTLLSRSRARCCFATRSATGGGCANSTPSHYNRHAAPAGGGGGEGGPSQHLDGGHGTDTSPLPAHHSRVSAMLARVAAKPPPSTARPPPPSPPVPPTHVSLSSAHAWADKDGDSGGANTTPVAVDLTAADHRGLAVGGGGIFDDAAAAESHTKKKPPMIPPSPLPPPLPPSTSSPLLSAADQALVLADIVIPFMERLRAYVPVTPLGSTGCSKHTGRPETHHIPFPQLTADALRMGLADLFASDLRKFIDSETQRRHRLAAATSAPNMRAGNNKTSSRNSKKKSASSPVTMPASPAHAPIATSRFSSAVALLLDCPVWLSKQFLRHARLRVAPPDAITAAGLGAHPIVFDVARAERVFGLNYERDLRSVIGGGWRPPPEVVNVFRSAGQDADAKRASSAGGGGGVPQPGPERLPSANALLEAATSAATPPGAAVRRKGSARGAIVRGQSSTVVRGRSSAADACHVVNALHTTDPSAAADPLIAFKRHVPIQVGAGGAGGAALSDTSAIHRGVPLQRRAEQALADARARVRQGMKQRLSLSEAQLAEAVAMGDRARRALAAISPSNSYHHHYHHTEEEDILRAAWESPFCLSGGLVRCLGRTLEEALGLRAFSVLCDPPPGPLAALAAVLLEERQATTDTTVPAPIYLPPFYIRKSECGARPPRTPTEAATTEAPVIDVLRFSAADDPPWLLPGTLVEARLITATTKHSRTTKGEVETVPHATLSDLLLQSTPSSLLHAVSERTSVSDHYHSVTALVACGAAATSCVVAAPPAPFMASGSLAHGALRHAMLQRAPHGSGPLWVSKWDAHRLGIGGLNPAATDQPLYAPCLLGGDAADTGSGAPPVPTHPPSWLLSRPGPPPSVAATAARRVLDHPHVLFSASQFMPSPLPFQGMSDRDNHLPAAGSSPAAPSILDAYLQERLWGYLGEHHDAPADRAGVVHAVAGGFEAPAVVGLAAHTLSLRAIAEVAARREAAMAAAAALRDVPADEGAEGAAALAMEERRQQVAAAVQERTARIAAQQQGTFSQQETSAGAGFARDWSAVAAGGAIADAAIDALAAPVPLKSTAVSPDALTMTARASPDEQHFNDGHVNTRTHQAGLVSEEGRQQTAAAVAALPPASVMRLAALQLNGSTPTPIWAQNLRDLAGRCGYTSPHFFSVVFLRHLATEQHDLRRLRGASKGRWLISHAFLKPHECPHEVGDGGVGVVVSAVNNTTGSGIAAGGSNTTNTAATAVSTGLEGDDNTTLSARVEPTRLLSYDRRLLRQQRQRLTAWLAAHRHALQRRMLGGTARGAAEALLSAATAALPDGPSPDTVCMPSPTTTPLDEGSVTSEGSGSRKEVVTPAIASASMRCLWPECRDVASAAALRQYQSPTALATAFSAYYSFSFCNAVTPRVPLQGSLLAAATGRDMRALLRHRLQSPLMHGLVVVNMQQLHLQALAPLLFYRSPFLGDEDALSRLEAPAADEEQASETVAAAFLSACTTEVLEARLVQVLMRMAKPLRTSVLDTHLYLEAAANAHAASDGAGPVTTDAGAMMMGAPRSYIATTSAAASPAAAVPALAPHMDPSSFTHFAFSYPRTAGTTLAIAAVLTAFESDGGMQYLFRTPIAPLAWHPPQGARGARRAPVLAQTLARRMQQATQFNAFATAPLTLRLWLGLGQPLPLTQLPHDVQHAVTAAVFGRVLTPLALLDRAGIAVLPEERANAVVLSKHELFSVRAASDVKFDAIQMFASRQTTDPAGTAAMLTYAPVLLVPNLNTSYQQKEHPSPSADLLAPWSENTTADVTNAPWNGQPPSPSFPAREQGMGGALTDSQLPHQTNANEGNTCTARSQDHGHGYHAHLFALRSVSNNFLRALLAAEALRQGHMSGDHSSSYSALPLWLRTDCALRLSDAMAEGETSPHARALTSSMFALRDDAPPPVRLGDDVFHHHNVDGNGVENGDEDGQDPSHLHSPLAAPQSSGEDEPIVATSAHFDSEWGGGYAAAVGSDRDAASLLSGTPHQQQQQPLNQPSNPSGEASSGHRTHDDDSFHRASFYHLSSFADPEAVIAAILANTFRGH